MNQSSADHASPQLEGRPAEAASAGLVMDIGVAGGADTAFYLAKGFRVISVEAGASACEKLSRRFAEPIAAGTLQLLRFIADSTFGLPRDFHVHKVHQGISGVSMHMREDLVHDYAHETALTIDWKTLIAQQGVPRYAKIDIEGNEENFLSGIAATGRLPEFISIECHKLPPVEMLYDMGYRRFRLVDQNVASSCLAGSSRCGGSLPMSLWTLPARSDSICLAMGPGSISTSCAPPGTPRSRGASTPGSTATPGGLGEWQPLDLLAHRDASIGRVHGRLRKLL